MDAGAADAGTPDAGTPDAGTPDAGTPDAGTPDAGTPDAGIVDAGIVDAGTPDAGTSDGGFTDAGVWTWLWQHTQTTGLPVWGLLGVRDAGNDPGMRDELASWPAPDGGLIVFGGTVHDVTSASFGPANDLWHYDGVAWVWLGGPAQVNGLASYGTKGVRSCSNRPGARSRPTTWVGGDGGLYLYGGEGYVAVGPQGVLSDTWRYDGCWTWVAGTNATNSPAVAGAHPGARSNALVWSRGAFAWIYGGEAPQSPVGELWRFDGAAWTVAKGAPTSATPWFSDWGQLGVSSPANTPGMRLGSATWVDAAGQLWLYGGHGYGAGMQFGALADLWKFDGTNWVWISGSTQVDALPSHGTVGWALSTNHPGARLRSTVWVDGTSVFLFGGLGRINEQWSDLWKFDGVFWTWVTGPDQPNGYPVRGSQGVPSPGNRPGTRSGGASAYRPGELLIYGGRGRDNSGLRTVSEAWRYQP